MFGGNVCRACLDDGRADARLTEDPLRTMFETVANLEVSNDDELPRRVCGRCYESIVSMYNFRSQCRTSDAILRDHAKNSIKIEIDKKIKQETTFTDEFVRPTVADNLEDGVVSPREITETKIRHTTDDDEILEENKKRGISLLINKSRNRSKIKLLVNASDKFQRNDFFVCGLCEYTQFESPEMLIRHLDSHKNDKFCLQCQHLFEGLPDLFSHRYQHITLNNRFSCHVCYKPMNTQKGLNMHLKKCHFNNKQHKSCNICNKAFTRWIYLRKHVKYTHAEEKCFSCTTCFKLFKSPELLKSHNKMHSMEKKFVCDECGFSCNFRGGLSSHISRRHGPIEQIKCEVCNKEFKSKIAYADHKRIHNTSCICTMCGKDFKRISMLKRHMLSHSDERPFSCKFCKASFKCSTQLNNHQRKHTGFRPYKCKYCSSAFYTHNVLIKHTRIHTGEKPYVCKICNKGFTGGHNLKVHMKVHGENLIMSKNMLH